MKHLSLFCSFIALASGLFGLYETFPLALYAGYGELPLFTPVLVAWAMWMGRRYGEPGPVVIPQRDGLAISMVCVAAAAILFELPWLATYLIAPASLIILQNFKPSLATPRVLLLFFIAPSSYLIDLYFGEVIQIATAANASWFTQVFDSSLGARTKNELACAPHKVVITSACSGARLAIRMVALSIFVSVLKRSHRHIIAWLVLAGILMSIVANTIRISVLCLAAPNYDSSDLTGLLSYHDTSGAISFLIAYLILAWINSRLASIYLDTNHAT